LNKQDHDKNMSARRRRPLLLTVLIVIITFFWILLMLYTNLPTLAMAGIGLVSLLVLAVATAWTAMAFPSRDRE